MFGMASYFYDQWYSEDVSPYLNEDQKYKLMHKISELTLRQPIWLDKDKNWIDKFPELIKFSNSGRITGLQLVSVMKGCLGDLQG